MLEIDTSLTLGALDLHVDLRVGAGPLVLIGPNGGGKTTTLLMVLGAIAPARGRIVLGGRVLVDTAQGFSLPGEHRGVGYVPQDYGLFPHLTVRENVRFGRACRGIPDGAGQAQGTEAWLERLDLLPLADRLPAGLSGGEGQRVALARALAAEPKALLLDEPLAALDPLARRRLRGWLAQLLRELALPAIVVTHDPDDAAALGERIAVLEGGRITQQGSLEELRAHPTSAFVAELAT